MEINYSIILTQHKIPILRILKIKLQKRITVHSLNEYHHLMNIKGDGYLGIAIIDVSLSAGENVPLKSTTHNEKILNFMCIKMPLFKQ